MTNPAVSPNVSKSATTFIFITVVIDMLGIGLVWPIMPKLIEEMTGGPVSNAATVYGLLVSGYALMQFLFAPIMGILSDRFGRRPIILISLAGLGLDYIILALAPTLAWIVVGRLMAGVLGATVSTSNAFIADVTPKEKRAAAFGMIGAAFGVGFIFGPLIGGVLGNIDLRYPFYLAAAISLLNVTFGYFVLPESLPREKRRAIRWKEANPLSALAQIKQYRSVAAFIIALFLAGLAQAGLQAIWVLWSGVQLGWNIADAGMSLAVVGVATVIVQGGLVRIIIPKFGERRVVFAGYLISALAFFCLPLVTAGWVIYAGIIVHIIGWGSAQPALQSLMSKAVPEDQQGLLQGTVSSVNSIGMIIGPIMATQIFALFTGKLAYVDYPGAWYFVGSVFFLLAVLVIWLDANRYRKRVAAE